MNDSMRIWYLIKFCKVLDHAESFMNGDIFMNRLSYFKKIEENGDGRSDRNEAVSHWLQPKGLKLQLNIPGIGETTITETDLAAPVTMSFEFHNDLHIFCMYAVFTEGLEPSNDQEYMEKVKSQIAMDERCLTFGEYAVVVPAPKFIEKLRVGLAELKKPARTGMVTYYDGATFNGEFDLKDVPFRKLNEFSYQKEFRICLNNQTQGDEPFTLNIGSLKDICQLHKSSELNIAFGLTDQ